MAEFNESDAAVADVPSDRIGNQLEGLVICVVGNVAAAFPKLGCDKIGEAHAALEKAVIAHGGSYSKSLSTAVTHLVCADEPHRCVRLPNYKKAKQNKKTIVGKDFLLRRIPELASDDGSAAAEGGDASVLGKRGKDDGADGFDGDFDAADGAEAAEGDGEGSGAKKQKVEQLEGLRVCRSGTFANEARLSSWLISRGIGKEAQFTKSLDAVIQSVENNANRPSKSVKAIQSGVPLVVLPREFPLIDNPDDVFVAALDLARSQSKRHKPKEEVSAAAPPAVAAAPPPPTAAAASVAPVVVAAPAPAPPPPSPPAPVDADGLDDIDATAASAAAAAVAAATALPLPSLLAD